MRIELDGLSEHIPGTGDFITINQSKCNGCGQCGRVCVVNQWKLKDGIAYIADGYQSKCLECGSCAQVCEPGAIEFRYPAGGTGVIYRKG